MLDEGDPIRRKREQAIQLADQFFRSLFLEMFGDPVVNPKRWPVYPSGELLREPPQIGTIRPVSQNGVYPVVRVGEIGIRSVRRDKKR
jgi:type I restriction enzyme S subunit